jgi:hypothetical protein
MAVRSATAHDAVEFGEAIWHDQSHSIWFVVKKVLVEGSWLFVPVCRTRFDDKAGAVVKPVFSCPRQGNMSL